MQTRPESTTIVKARWVAPMDRPLIRDGAIAFTDGTIVAVGPATQLGDGDVVDLGNSLILPGLVNAHTHLELSDCPNGDAPEGRFVDWLLSLPQRLRRPERDLEQVCREAVPVGIAQCLKFGVTTIGDISQNMHLTRPIIANSPLRCVSYGEVIGLAKRRPRFDELLPLALDTTYQTDRLHIGLSPHAPYTVDLPGFRRCIEIARQRKLPLATHLAESPDEEEFLVHHTGQFQWAWEHLGQWAEPVETFRAAPIDFAREVGLLDYPSLLAHLNYCNEAELETLARGKASIVYCPRTHRYFGHPPHPWRRMLARGINIAVGTDSCASSPDLNLVDDLRLLRQIAPDLTAQELWQMATTRAARALTMQDCIGSLTAGKHADFIAFPVTSTDPLEEVLQEHSLPTGVWIGGIRV